MDLNQNISECMVEASDLFSTTVTNICTGATHVVEHGSFDIAMGVMLIGIMVAASLMICAVAVGIMRGF